MGGRTDVEDDVLRNRTSGSNFLLFERPSADRGVGVVDEDVVVNNVVVEDAVVVENAVVELGVVVEIGVAVLIGGRYGKIANCEVVVEFRVFRVVSQFISTSTCCSGDPVFLPNS